MHYVCYRVPLDTEILGIAGLSRTFFQLCTNVIISWTYRIFPNEEIGLQTAAYVSKAGEVI